jgi:hypothetical protein
MLKLIFTTLRLFAHQQGAALRAHCKVAGHSGKLAVAGGKKGRR